MRRTPRTTMQRKTLFFPFSFPLSPPSPSSFPFLFFFVGPPLFVQPMKLSSFSAWSRTPDPQYPAPQTLPSAVPL